MISLSLNNNKKHAVPPPRLSYPNVGKQEKNGLSHCTALLKNYCLELLKKNRWNLSKIVVQRCFSNQRMFTIIPKYHGGPMSRCTVLDPCPTLQQLQFFDEMIWWCNHKMVSYLLQKWYRTTKWYFPIENQHFGVYIKHSDPYCDFPFSVTQC